MGEASIRPQTHFRFEVVPSRFRFEDTEVAHWQLFDNCSATHFFTFYRRWLLFRRLRQYSRFWCRLQLNKPVFYGCRLCSGPLYRTSFGVSSTHLRGSPFPWPSGRRADRPVVMPSGRYPARLKHAPGLSFSLIFVGSTIVSQCIGRHP